MLEKRPTKELIRDFILTGHYPNTAKNAVYVPTVRGWIMDELEKRDFEAFMKWLDQDVPTDESLFLFF